MSLSSPLAGNLLSSLLGGSPRVEGGDKPFSLDGSLRRPWTRAS
jgi:hypothetical protein